jgi:chemotaxis protein methyltransferase CheR
MVANTASDLEKHKLLNEQLQNDDVGYLKVEAILRAETGIHMPPNDKNRALMASRLISTLKQRGLKSYREYAKLLALGNPADIKELVESLTTNKTEFYREAKHFDLLIRELPRLLTENKAAGRREFRIWCAAASTGQEPYTLAMTLCDNIPDIAQWNIKFLASDIDTQVLQKSAKGVYTEREYEGLPKTKIAKYFTRLPGNTGTIQANSDLRGMINFAQFNLMTDPYPFEHKFDVIFCRNVLIYFDRPTGSGVIERLSAALRPGGILFIGHTETGIPKPDFVDTLDVAAYISKRTF